MVNVGASRLPITIIIRDDVKWYGDGDGDGNTIAQWWLWYDNTRR